MLVSAGGGASADAFEESWSDAFTRCRVAVEEAHAFDGAGLERAAEAERLSLARPAQERKIGQRSMSVPAIAAPDELWHVPGRRFSVYVTQTSCTVHQRAGVRVTVDEVQRLIARFKADRDALVAQGSHEVRLVKSLAGPVTQFVFRPTTRNARGRCVISTIAWTLKSVRAGTGEQTGQPCDLPERQDT